jgi:hypothetical protein
MGMQAREVPGWIGRPDPCIEGDAHRHPDAQLIERGELLMRAQNRRARSITAAALLAVGLSAAPGLATPHAKADHQEGGAAQRPASSRQGDGRADEGKSRNGSDSTSEAKSAGSKSDDRTPASKGTSSKSSSRDATKRSETRPGTHNSGSIKIARIGDDTHTDNDPHPGCTFRVDFYGFQAGTYTLTIRTISPTGDALLVTDSVTLATDARGNEFQTSRTYDVSAGLTGAPHAQQGYHLRVDVKRTDTNGEGSKTKVFWLDCAPAGDEVAGPGTGDETSTSAEDRDRKVLSAGTGDDTAVLGVMEMAGDREVAASDGESSRPRVLGALARTGYSILALLLLALATIGGGAVLLGRRKANQQ